jgi:hypothetical protein
MTQIPDDIQKVAIEAFSKICEGRSDQYVIVDALLAERQSAYLRGLQDGRSLLTGSRAILSERARSHDWWIAGRDAAAERIEQVALEMGEQRCCGFGPGSPPECCADPVFMIADRDAVRVIAALEPPAEIADTGKDAEITLLRAQLAEHKALLREANTYVEYVADGEAGSNEGLEARSLAARIAALGQEYGG